MSKIYEGNWKLPMAGMYWKQFAESATGWLNKYRIEPIFRTEINIVGLQILFALVILGLVGISFDLLYNDISSALQSGVQSGVLGTQAADIIGQIEAIKRQNLLVIISVIVFATILFGYIIARAALSPARNAFSAQKQFIGNIAHELRTPLSIIKTNTEVALYESGISPDLKTTLLSNVEELDRVSEIINNLLSLSTLLRPERVEFAAVDLSYIVTDSVQKFSQLIRHGDLHVTTRKSPDMLVWGNATALTQVVNNLLKNAITYTPRGGQISVTVESSIDNEIVLRLRDTGMGIARKDLFRIFEPFYRADSSRTRGGASSGLGLAIVAELVKLHRGKITIRSAVGQGTLVSVFLPGIAGRGVVGGPNRQSALNEIAVDFSKQT